MQVGKKLGLQLLLKISGKDTGIKTISKKRESI